MTARAASGNLKGITLMTAAMAVAALADALIKITADTVPAPQILLVVGFGGVLVFGGIALWRQERLLSRDFFHPAALTRSFGEVMGTGSIILVLPVISLSLLTVMLQAVPIIVTLGAILFLGERAGWRRWVAILVGFAGVLIILRPGTEAFTPAVLLAVLAAFGQSIRDLASRAAPPHISTLQLAVWGFVIFGMASLVIAVADGRPVPPIGPSTAVGLILIVVLAGTVALLVISAMRVGDVAVVAPFRYTRLLFGVGLGLVLFDERLDPVTILGGSLVVASGLYTWHREVRARQIR
jgi:drug/metabolite transporter (DMT)-like permease